MSGAKVRTFKVKVRTFKKYYYFNIKIIILSESRDLRGGGDTLRSDFKSFGAAQALKNFACGALFFARSDIFRVQTKLNSENL